MRERENAEVTSVMIIWPNDRPVIDKDGPPHAARSGKTDLVWAFHGRHLLGKQETRNDTIGSGGPSCPSSLTRLLPFNITEIG